MSKALFGALVVATLALAATPSGAALAPQANAAASDHRTPTPTESPSAWGLYAEAVKLGSFVTSTSGASMAMAQLHAGTVRIDKIYKVASDGLLYELRPIDQQAWRGIVGPGLVVDWTPLHGFTDRGRTIRQQLIGNVLRTVVSNPDGTKWGPWESVLGPHDRYLPQEHVPTVRAQLDDWERRFDTTIAAMEAQGIATDGADDARWARQRRLRESNARASAILEGLGSALSSAQVVASANEAQSRAALDATLAEAKRRQRPGADAAERKNGQAVDSGSAVGGQAAAVRSEGSLTNSAATTASAATSKGAPLRFALQLGLRNPVNGINGVCFSNVITLSGPPGWPVESSGAAMALVEPYRKRMRSACAARAELQDSAPAEVVWNSRGRETAPEDNVAHWRAARQIEVDLR